MTTSAEETLLAGAKTARSNVADLFATLDSSDSYLLTTKDSDGNEVTVDGNVYSSSQYSSDRDLRERAYTTYFESLARVQDIFASTLNTYARLSEDIASAYHYDAALDLEMDVRDLDTGVFDTLVAGTREHLDVLATGNELRASILGVDELMPWDRVAPLATAPTTSYSYEEAQSIMLAAFAPLGDDYIAKLQEAFDSRWIDVYPTDGKSTVATSYFMMSDHPYLGMSYTGDIYSLFTMAYQLGCFMFDLYALQSPKSYYSLSFLPLSTDATSYVNQLLLADYLIEHAQTDGDKVYHLTSKIELLESSFFRPVMMAAFEKQARDIVVGGGTLTADALNGIWNDLYTEFYPGVTIPDGNEVGWTFVSSYYSDFHAQDYAFVIAAAYKVAGDCESGDSEAVANYLEFLAAGNSVPVDELYDLIGIDLSSEDYIADLADTYAALVAEVKELL